MAWLSVLCVDSTPDLNLTSRSRSSSGRVTGSGRVDLLSGHFVALVSCRVAAPAPPKILAFGDSWAYLGYDQFKSIMQSHGFQTEMLAIPGTPATCWSLIQPHALVNEVTKHNITHVYFSLGGNDFLDT